QQLAGVAVIDTTFAERLAETVRDAAMDLTVHDQRIDRAPDIVDGGVAGDFDDPGLRIDLDFANVTAIREARETDGLVAFSRERPTQLVGQVVAPQRLGCGLEDAERAVCSLDPEATFGKFQIGR